LGLHKVQVRDSLARSYPRRFKSASAQAIKSREWSITARVLANELARAQRRIAALERKVGQQQVELDLQQTLRETHRRLA
jgi:hypothetical protein